MPYLKHVPTGDLYPYNADMALREDMVEYVPDPVPEPRPEAKPKSRAKPKPKQKAEPVQEDLDFDLDELPTLEDE